METSLTNLDPERLNQFVGKMLGDLGGAFSLPTVRIGFRLGLFDALHASGPTTAGALADSLGLSRRYVQEWALAQAANGYVTHDPAAQSFRLTAEQSMVFAVKDSPVYLEGAFDVAAAMVAAEPKVEHGFRTGEGVAWGDGGGCLFCAVGAFFRPGYVNAIVQSWLPALDGMVPRLEAGAKVADIGCGVGFSTLLMARAFPNSSFVGYDFHGPSIEQANAHAAAHGLAGRVRFEAVRAKDIADHGLRPGDDVRLPARHGRPAGLCRPYPRHAQARRHLDAGRTHRIRRSGRRVGQPGHPAVLQRVHHDLRPHLARAGSRRGPGGAGR